MGACCVTKKHINIEKFISNKLIEAIERNSADKVRQILERYSKTNIYYKDPTIMIDDPVIKIHQVDMNPLGYALYLGAAPVFKVLYEEGHAKLSIMTKFFLQLGKRPIEVLCELGHLSLLEYYLPLYLGNKDQAENSDDEQDSEELSIFAKSRNTKSHTQEKSKISAPLSTMTPIQRAVEKGRLELVKFFREYFREKPNDEFNVHFIDEATGENCALISCKTGNIDLIKYLHETMGADFQIVNKRKENAIQIAAVWSKKRKSKQFKECVRYLVEEVGVDYTYEFEETLLVLEDKSIVAYLENKLHQDGISVSKSRVDDKYSLSKNRPPAAVIDPNLEERLSKIKGPEFNFTELFKEELEDANSNISSISVIQSKSFSQVIMDSPIEKLRM
ncbi:unnamed protein product [Blepharisma stoltei]|uniref:Uncharacterized protein n=1 Tax=Blepharisma stoltei TaxID=1481888 RepID=A0AAU9JKM5_9CILI|nr:unnamed protein product [Blepharisma stoltei]